MSNSFMIWQTNSFPIGIDSELCRYLCLRERERSPLSLRERARVRVVLNNRGA